MTDLDLLITSARTSTHAAQLVDIAIAGGRIVAVTSSGESTFAAAKTIDAGGRWVIPGAIDTHSHIGQLAPEYSQLPGFEPEENWAHETRGAIAGGVTTALNYVKFGQTSLLDACEDGVARARRQSRMNVLFHGYIMNESHLKEVPEAARAGMRTFKMFMPYRGQEASALGGIGSLNHAQLRMAFEAIAAEGCQALVHAEDGDIVEHCMAHEFGRGVPDLESWERSRPVEAEGDAAWTALYLAERANCPVTIVHVSSPEAIRARRAAAYPHAALESCPHYSVLSTASPIGAYGKVAPPLRTPELADAVTEAVLAGEIDFFGSDHNVWPAAAKADLINGRAGLPGIGLMLPIVLTHFVYRRKMSMERAVELTSTNAARRFGLHGKGWIGSGADADLVVLDEGRRTIAARQLLSAVDFSPYEGYELLAWPMATICGGRLVYADGAIIDDDFRGSILNEPRASVAT